MLLFLLNRKINMKKPILLTMSLLITPQIFAGNLLERFQERSEHNGETIHFSPLDYSTKDEAKQHLVHIFKPKEEPKIET